MSDRVQIPTDIPTMTIQATVPPAPQLPLPVPPIPPAAPLTQQITSPTTLDSNATPTNLPIPVPPIPPAPNSDVQDIPIPPVPPATIPSPTNGGTPNGAGGAGGSGGNGGGGAVSAPAAPSASPNTPTPAAIPPPSDFRVRLGPLPSALDQVYGASGSSVLDPLRKTGGVMFPYSPQITFTQDVMYQDVTLTHTNSDYEAYQRTPSVSLTINGKFTCQTKSDGIYALACLHFLRVVSKMYFGDNYNGAASTFIGLPPPILLLNGYGSYMFNNLRVLLKSHTFTYDQQMDIVKITPSGGGTVYLPAMFELGVTLKVQQTPNMQRTQFDLGKFRTGALMQTGGWI